MMTPQSSLKTVQPLVVRVVQAVTRRAQQSLPAARTGENGGDVSGKMPRFVWSKEQKHLLKEILSSFAAILKNWKRYVEECYVCIKAHSLILLFSFSSRREGGGSDKVSRITEQLTDKKNLFLVSNAVQLTALVVDSMVSQTGGIKTLMAECCRLATAKKRQLSMLEVFYPHTHFNLAIFFLFSLIL